MSVGAEPNEIPVASVRGTRDWMPEEFARLKALEALLLERFSRAGYEPMRTPALEPTELHERKSGAAIVTRLFELVDGHPSGLCLRPELTAGIVRAYTVAAEAPALPFRASHAGPVFRREKVPRPGLWREFQQVGAELIGASGPAADGEVIWLADWALAESGVRDATIRLGHVGLILEMLRLSGLPAPARTALVETLSEAAAEGGDVTAMDRGLDGLADWLASAGPEETLPLDRAADDPGVDRLFRTLVPVVNGRRPGHEIVRRLRRKWELGHSLLGSLGRVREKVRALSELKGPPGDVLDRLARDHADLAPDSVAEIRELVETLGHYGIAPDRIALDFGFGRGIGFYSQVVFELAVPTPEGPVEVCGGGRYDGLARVLGSDRDDRGVGFAFGLERLQGVLDAREGAAESRARMGFLVLAATPRTIPHAVRLATYLRAKGARIILETDRDVEQARARAEALGLPRLVVVSGPMEDPDTLKLHDLARGTVSDTLAYALRQLVREDVEGRRR